MEEQSPESQLDSIEASAADFNDQEISSEEIARLNTASQPYVGRWNSLVSTTNWEKGRIIAQWRQSLSEQQVPATEYSDEAWASRVGSVTGQHVGRLRRVYERFGDVYEKFDKLFWSHFQAAIDWEDAEMWLEGAVQNGWSVATMRGQRWETMGSLENERPNDADVVVTELDEDFEPHAEGGDSELKGSVGEIEPHDGMPVPEGPDFGDEDAPGALPREVSQTGDDSEAPFEEQPALVKPFSEIGKLPEDVLDAFDAMKLAIIRHKAMGWTEIKLEEMISCIESLKVLANAPSGEPVVKPRSEESDDDAPETEAE
ncbi:hypothetical protein LOC68_12770 [Blastopirellula sp. JC732]|uniref:Uncharacterized protein n=1 Tax=Blastopirellula sediminis TaxID=2894196 RepID=A0A9X1MPK4_9BACT|nr:hypothetical protein [Blastopirellula sediminis]MCC9607438.1 hypothetical protein [Blastopirellula sediminis]MCC9629269.1 hypothetical protein [Blastopirellula sediminis]